MPIGLVFWVTMLICLLFGLWGATEGGRAYFGLYSHWILFFLLFLLGWGVFGFAIYR